MIEPENALDPHGRPPQSTKTLYKRFQKANPQSIDSDPDVLDLARQAVPEQNDKIHVIGHIKFDTVRKACSTFSGYNVDEGQLLRTDLPIFECTNVPGLLLIHALLPKQTQEALLARLLHDALADPRHKNNVDAHYKKPHSLLRDEEDKHPVEEIVSSRSRTARSSFFDLFPDSTNLVQPLDSAVHQPLTISQFLRKKLRWIDLGSQYNWTDKTYHTEGAPPFPSDIADLMQPFFPETKPEVAIVNLYSPGDTLSLHRDVSESATNGLISVSFGCDGIFIIGLEGGDGQMKNLAIRLHSGDAVYMSQSARYAWHGVPLILPGTCPSFLTDWPAQAADETEQTRCDNADYETWRGWMSTKRINLNIRQLNKEV